MNKQIIELVNPSASIYAIPEVFSILNAKLKEPYVSNAQLADIIHKDPALTLSILKIVNSSFYGFPSTISTVTQAILILGRKELATIVFSTCSVNVFNKLSIHKSILNQHWQHSLLCGLLAKQLARHCAYENDQEALFVAGLLHDIGRLILWHKLPSEMEQVAHILGERPLEDCAVEFDIFGFTHAEVGAALMRLWDVPPLIVLTTEQHHQPDSATKYTLECQLINIADVLAHIETINNESMCLVEKYTGGNPLGFEQEKLLEIHELAKQQLQEMIGIFIH